MSIESVCENGEKEMRNEKENWNTKNKNNFTLLTMGSSACARIGWVGQAQYDLLMRLAQSFFIPYSSHKTPTEATKHTEQALRTK